MWRKKSLIEKGEFALFFAAQNFLRFFHERHHLALQAVHKLALFIFGKNKGTSIYNVNHI